MFDADDQTHDHRFVVVTDQRDHVLWLKDALASLGEVVVADAPEVDRVAQLVDATTASLVLVHFDNERLLERRRLVEELGRLKPLLAMVAFGDGPGQSLLLTLMRLGVRDFLPVGAPAREVASQVSRLLAQRPPSQDEARGGSLYALCCARPGTDSATLAVHLALGLVRRLGEEQPVLLLDLGLPAGDCLQYLDLKPSYTVLDAVRGVRRFDRQLVNTAFARHPDGLSVLALPEEVSRVPDIGAADAAVLLNALASYFSHLVVNLGGLPAGELACQVLTRARRRLVITEQSVHSVEATRRLIEQLGDPCKNAPAMGLVVDRYLRRLEPNAEAIAQLLGLPLSVTLPASGLNRLKAANAGYSLFQAAPRDPYLKAVQRLLDELLRGGAGGRPAGRLLARLRRKPSAPPPPPQN